MRTQVSSLKSDNVKLYEKLRYVEYKGNSANPKSIDLEDKYRTDYEDSLDPFRQFHVHEERRRTRALNPFEQGVLVMTRMLVSNRYSRMIFVIYSSLLHLLVLFTLYQVIEAPPCAKTAGLNLKAKPG